MVRSVETIRKELKALDDATATLAEEFDRLYRSYMEALGQAIRQQVVLATYHLCTQVYPDAFLDLSVSQRETLQKHLRQLGRDGQRWLQELMEETDSETPNFEDLPSEQQERISRLTAALEAIPVDEEDAEQSNDPPEDSAPDEAFGTEEETNDPLAQEIRAVPIQFIPVDAGAGREPQPEEPASETSEPELGRDLPGQTDPQEEGEPSAESGPDRASLSKQMDPKSLIQSVIMAAMAEDMQESLSGRPFTGDDLTPTQLAKHHLILEQRIRRVLHRVSKQANQQLKRSNVIPDLPEAVLDAAAEAETGPEKGRSMPNLLSVLVEMSSDMDNDADEEDPEDDEDDFGPESQDEEDAIQGMMTHLAAINLRLSDLEFADVQSSMWRSKLRTALGKLRKLGKQYQRTQRELAIAEAEQAWRTIWYDDSADYERHDS
jgi:hypothetical protein